MKIAKLKTTPIYTDNYEIIDKYYLVNDLYDFIANDADDMTSVSTLLIFRDMNRYDSSVFRDSIRDNIVPNWNSLSFDVKKECVRYYRYPTDISQEEWDSYFTASEHEYNWNVIVNDTRDCRLSRLFAAFQKISYLCTEVQVMMIYLAVKEMCYDYCYANLPHLLLWIQNASYPELGIDYTNAGLANMSGYTTLLRDSLLDILVNGNYQR